MPTPIDFTGLKIEACHFENEPTFSNDRNIAGYITPSALNGCLDERDNFRAELTGRNRTPWRD
jgi:hypothetical protein